MAMILRQIPASLDPLLEVSKADEIIGCHFPDFLIIGPQRTGTTWLSEGLRRHPNIFISSPKEIHFFSLLKLKNHKLYKSNDLSWYVRHFSDPAEEFARKSQMMLELYGVEYAPQVRGEATASYAAMDTETIALIHRLNPDIKAIMMVRDPVERAWSHAKKDLARELRRNWQQVPDHQFKDFFVNPYQLRCGHFSTIITQWSGTIKKENLLILPFAHLEEKPDHLLKRVLNFLGIDSPAKYLQQAWVKQKTNTTGDQKIPPQFRTFLEELFQKEVKILETQFGISFKKERCASSFA